jgi:hypothetical protein
MLGTEHLSWRRLRVVISGLSNDRTSSLWRKFSGELGDWPLTVQLLASAVNALRILAWQNTEDATKRNPRHRPEPILPPGTELPPHRRKTKRIGDARMSLSEAKDWLGW